MDIIFELLVNSKDYEIREGCLSFFYNLASGIGTEFEPFLDKLMEITLKLAASEVSIIINLNFYFKGGRVAEGN